MADRLDEPELDRAAAGDPAAWRALVDRHHPRLRRMVALRLDPRLRGRVDPSDVLQEAYLDAARRLPDYLRDPPLPFFLWLRQLAGTRLAKAHRHHLGTHRRDARREFAAGGVPEASSAALAAQLLGPGTGRARPPPGPSCGPGCRTRSTGSTRSTGRCWPCGTSSS